MPEAKRVFKLSEIDSVAQWIIDHATHCRVICFEGDLGAGKTTLISAVCKQLGVKEHVSSPTFSLINVYSSQSNPSFKEVIHMDLYRFSGEEEAMRVGIDEYIHGGNLCLIEWPQKAPGILPDKYLRVQLSVLGSDERSIELS